MKNSSLEKAAELFVKPIDELNEIDNIDKAELIINVPHFLDINDYRENVKILSRRKKNEKYNKNRR